MEISTKILGSVLERKNYPMTEKWWISMRKKLYYNWMVANSQSKTNEKKLLAPEGAVYLFN